MPNICIIEIKVADLDIARAFYCDKLDFAVKTENYLPKVLVLEHKGVDLILHIAKEPININYPNSSQSLLIFETDNMETTIKMLQANNVEIVDGPNESPPGTFIAFRDPFGNVHGMMELNRQTK